MIALIIATIALSFGIIGITYLTRRPGSGVSGIKSVPPIRPRVPTRRKLLPLGPILLGTFLFCLSLFTLQGVILADEAPVTDKSDWFYQVLPPAIPQSKPALAAIPSVSLNVPGQVFIGDSFSFSVTFDNTGGDPGYGPFIDLVFPVNGADGAAGTDTADGIDFASATYLGTPVTVDEQIFPDDGGGTGCVDHPYAEDTSHTPLQVCGTAGDKLVVLQLPFGSFTNNQPPATVTVNANLSNLADLGTSLPIYARGGFQFGQDPLDNPCCDATVVSVASTDSATWPGSPVEPVLLSISKSYSGPENETATGPNYPRQYTIDVELAPGQVVNNLVITDTLPNNMAFVRVVSIAPAGGTATLTPTVGAAANPPNNILQVEYPSVTGGTTIQVVFEYFIPQNDAGSSPVIDAGNGDDVTSENKVATAGNWDPIDGRDPLTPTSAGGVCPGCPPAHTLTDKAIAVQKAVALAVDNSAAGYSPGDVVEFTIDFQISDYFTFGNIVVTDTFSDGMRLDSSFTPTLSVSDRNDNIVAGNFISGTNFFVDTSQIGNDTLPGTNGSTTLTFDVSQAMINLGAADGILQGGRAVLPDDIAATGTVTFRTVIQEEFSDDYPSGDKSVDHGDTMDNAVTIAGDVLNNGSLIATGAESDSSGASLTIVNGSLDKSIYAINGSTTFSTPVQVSPGYTVTYRLQYNLPTSNFEDLSFIDYLPLPVFSAATVSTFNPVIDATVPPVGEAKFGPSETFYTSNAPGSQIVPAITTDAVANSVTFTYGDYDDPSNAVSTIDILFTVEVSDEPFADELFLTNQARVNEGSTNAGSSQADAIIQIEILEPVLVLSKGVLGSDNPKATASPPVTAPATFPLIDSSDLAANPVDSDISNVDAGDLINFAVVVENQGHSGGFDLVVKDAIVPGFVIPPGGINLNVVRGDGLAIGYNLVGGGPYGDDRDFLYTGIELIDPSGEGICQPYTAPPGTNIVIITYDLMVDPTVQPPDTVPNTATLENYAGAEGGPNHVDDPLSTPAYNDQATTTIASPAIDKTFINTNQAHTTGTNIAVGEIITYTVTVNIPEGVSPDAYLEDNMDSGLAFVDMVSISNSNPASLTITNWPPITTVTSSGRRLKVDFGTITNTNRTNSVTETITMTYQAVVLNDSNIYAGRNRNNRARWYWDAGSQYVQDSAPNARVLEPQLQVIKTADPTAGDAADTITFTLTVQNSGANTTDAFEVALSDVIPGGMTYVAGSLAHTAGITPATLDDAGNPMLAASWDTLPANESSELQFQVTLDTGNSPNLVLTNTANISWTSLSGNVTTPQSTHNTASTERTGDTSNPGGTQNDYRNSGSAGVNVNTPGLSKSLVGTDQSFTSGANVTIGEIVTYSLVMTLPEGISSAFTVTDYLPAGLAYVAGSGQTDTTGFNGVLPAPTITSNGLSGDPVFFEFGPTTVTADNDPANNSFTIRLKAQVLDEPGNIGLPPGQTTLVNTATLRFANGSESASNNVSTPVVEPNMVLAKTFAPAQAIAGDVVTITLALNNSGTSRAFDVIVEDPLPKNLFTTVSPASTPAGFTFSTSSALTETLVRYTGGNVDVGQTLYFTFTAQLTSPVVPLDTYTNTAVVTQATTLPGSTPDERNEPQKEGKGTLNIEVLSLGNRVWLDVDNSGHINGGESGINGVVVGLYKDANTDGIADGPAILTDTTANGGYYLFDNLGSGSYLVEVAPGNFQAGGVLEGRLSSSGPNVEANPDNNGDSNDNGLDDANPDVNGIWSGTITVTHNAEPTTEIDLESGVGSGSADNDNSNLTVDFGFYGLVSVGDYVWIDANANGQQDENVAGPDGINNSGDEPGVNGITVYLFSDGDVPGVNPPQATAVTADDANGNPGFYLFNNLPPGNYFVQFDLNTLPSGYVVTQQNVGNDTTDSDANTSTGVTASTGFIPTGNQNLTLDMGLYRPNIQVDKSINIASVAPNQIVTYTINITNTGDVPLNPVIVTDTMDPGLTYQAGTANPGGVSVNGQELSWADVTGGVGLAPNAGVQITFLASVTTTTGIYVNTALVEGIHPTGSVTGTDDVPVIVEDPAVAVDKGVVPPGVVDGVITFTIRITNTGPSTLEQIPLIDHFSGPIVYIGGTPTADTVDNANGTLSWNDLTSAAPNGFGANLDPGNVFVITTAFSLTTTGTDFSMTNAATVTNAIDVLTNPANDDADAVTLTNVPTAITLLYFEGDRVGGNIVLNWGTAVEVDNFGFKLLRSTTGQLADAVEIGFVNGQGHGTASGASYTFTDQNVETAQSYTYWLVDVDFNGTETVQDPITVSGATLDGGGSSTIFLPLIFKQ